MARYTPIPLRVSIPSLVHLSSASARRASPPISESIGTSASKNPSTLAAGALSKRNVADGEALRADELYEQPRFLVSTWFGTINRLAPCGRKYVSQQANILSHLVGAVIFLLWTVIYWSTSKDLTEAQILHIIGLAVGGLLFLTSSQAHFMHVIHVEELEEKKICGFPRNGVWRAIDMSMIHVTVATNACADLSVMAMGLGQVNDPSSASACQADLCSQRTSGLLQRLEWQAYLDPSIAGALAILARMSWQLAYGKDRHAFEISPTIHPKEGYLMQDDGEFSASLNLMTAVILFWFVVQIPLAVATLPIVPLDMSVGWPLTYSLGVLALVSSGLYYTTWYGGGTCCIPTQDAVQKMHMHPEERRAISMFTAWCGFPHFHWHVVSGLVALAQAVVRQIAIEQILGNCQ
jgi:hypothetical protein